MATGSGKTIVMSMLIAWQVLNKVTYPKDTRFSKNILVIAPGLTVKSRLQVLIPDSPGNNYDEFNIIPVGLADRLKMNLCDVTIISANGKSKIPYYQLLCRAFGIPYFTVVDLDGGNKDESDNKRPCSWVMDNALAVFAKSFEEELGISRNAEHKASSVLVKIDGMDNNHISAAIKENIKAIVSWCAK